MERCLRERDIGEGVWARHLRSHFRGRGGVDDHSFRFWRFPAGTWEESPADGGLILGYPDGNNTAGPDLSQRTTTAASQSHHSGIAAVPYCQHPLVKIFLITNFNSAVRISLSTNNIAGDAAVMQVTYWRFTGDVVVGMRCGSTGGDGHARPYSKVFF